MALRSPLKDNKWWRRICLIGDNYIGRLKRDLYIQFCPQGKISLSAKHSVILPVYPHFQTTVRSPNVKPCMAK